MLFEPLRAAFRSLRFSLLMWNTGVVLLMVIPTLFAVREGLRQTLFRELDQALAEDLLEVELAVKDSRADLSRARAMLERKAQGHALHGWFVELFDAEDGTLQWASSRRPTEELPPPPLSPQTSIAESPGYRFAQRAVAVPNGPRLIVRVGSALEPVRSDVELLTRMIVGAGALILILAPIGGYWLSGRATRPIVRIIETTAHLRPNRLEERLPIRHTGDELDRLSLTINGLLDRIGNYLERNRQFAANAAHELRSPLAAIRSSVEVALNADRSPEEYVGLLGDVMEECSHLELLVHQLLLLAEGESGAVSQSVNPPARLDQIVEKSVQMFQGVAEARGVHLQTARLAPVCVRGEPHHLRQVVNNLVDNAIKFTTEGGQVSIGVGTDATAKRAVLRVRDTGIGISPEQQAHIFDRFYRGDKSRRDPNGQQRGHGLGLSICQTLVTALGGAVVVESALGEGSEFVVHLPLSESSGAC